MWSAVDIYFIATRKLRLFVDLREGGRHDAQDGYDLGLGN